MAAREDELQSLVGQPGFLLGYVHLLQAGEQLPLACERPVAPQPVDRAIPGRGHDPRAWVVGRRVAPALERGREGVLDGVLREGGIAGRPRDRGDRAAPLLAENARDVYVETSAWRITTGRTSTVPARADGIFAAHSIASSSEAASTR